MKNNINIDAVDLVRKIRDKNYRITKNMTRAEKIKYIHEKAEAVDKKLFAHSK